MKVDMGGVAEKLKELGPKLARRGLRKALNTVGDYWVPEVQQRAPVLLGDLRNSIIKKVKTRKNKEGDVGWSVEVGPAMNAPRTDGKDSVGPGIYAMWVEFGLKKIYPKQPFMRPTFDATSEKVVKLFSETLKEALEEIAKE